jgi:4-diphosphocytidyl-2-C-methyl-D-erythritol kinase
VRLRALAPAKVNLCLFLGPTREDGRHELVTLYESLSLYDELEMGANLDPGARDRVVCPEIAQQNLVERALEGLRAAGWTGPPVEVSIRKRIPIAAGMAGGSADAAATLRLATTIAPIAPHTIDRLAAGLGADVPAQLLPGVAIGTGAGEVVQRHAPLPAHAFVVIPSEHRLPTPAVFEEADRLGLPRLPADLRTHRARLQDALRTASELPPDLIVNDLQPAAVSLCPSIGGVLDEVRDHGADHALVSGSGPTVVGLWWGDDAGRRAAEAAEALKPRHPEAQPASPVGADAGLPRVI